MIGWLIVGLYCSIGFFLYFYNWFFLWSDNEKRKLFPMSIIPDPIQFGLSLLGYMMIWPFMLEEDS